MIDSIRGRLLLTLLSLTTLLWLFTAISSYQESQHEIEELFDAQLAQSARTLLSVAQHELEELDGIPETVHIHFLPQNTENSESRGHEYENKLAYQLWAHPQQRLIVRTFSAPETPMSNLLDGFGHTLIEGRPWRTFSLYERHSGHQIIMGEALAIREELSQEITLRLVVPMLLALPLLAISIYFAIGRSLRPLQRTADAIAQRDPQHLTRVSTRYVPNEIMPILDALNRLFGRVEQTLENERRFTADAAHELRTPLAALKVQAQVAQRSHDETERQHALAQLLSGTERASRVVAQLLTLARLDPDTPSSSPKPLALCPLLEEGLATIESKAAEKQIDLQLNCNDKGWVTAEAQAISILLRNLLDNAIRYSPPATRVTVTVQTQSDTLLLTVDDDGPGIPETERDRVFQRFYRLAGQELEGSGLGLSIVQRIAKSHHADIELGTSPSGGLRVQLRFPRYIPV